MKLTPCTSCARLVRITDVACPFCSAAVAVTADGGSPVAKYPFGYREARHLSRAAMLVGAAAIGIACSGTGQAPMYGSPPPDASVDGSDDAKADGPIAMYGGPPVDSGLDAAPDGPIAAYGGPPLDASKQD
jgi:hypothetical protein